MKAGTQCSWRKTFQHALFITIGLYLSTFPIPLPQTNQTQIKLEAIEKLSPPKNCSDRSPRSTHHGVHIPLVRQISLMQVEFCYAAWN